MNFYFKFFLWENGEKARDLSEYLTIPIFIEDRLNEELDSGEVILDGVPISMKSPLAPKTKVRIERYKKADYSDVPKKWDMVVEHDDVEIYAGEPSLCCHRISMIEASVIAQGIHVDNIALTYELQDVSINYKTYREDSTLIGETLEVIDGGYSLPIKQPTDPSAAFDFGGPSFMQSSAENYFRNSYAYRWRGVESLKSLKLNLSSAEQTEITFNIPQLICQACPEGNEFVDIFEMNTVTKVYRIETSFNKPLEGTKTLVLERENGALSFTDVSTSAHTLKNNFAYLRKIQPWKQENYSTSYQNDSFKKHYATDSDPIAYASNQFNNKTITFLTSALSESEIESGKGYLYQIECMPKPYSENSIVEYYSIKCYAEGAYFNQEISIGVGYWAYRSQGSVEAINILSANSMYVLANINVRDLSENAEGGPLLLKGVKYSCYDLFRKAMISTDSYIINNEEIGIDQIEFPIIIDAAWINRLKASKVQETILENKNLWEVFLQMGYYLHAIPYLEFATDGTDRFVLNFKQLGDVNKEINKQTSSKITVFNSHNLNDYFSQYDSYVTNIFSPQNEVQECLVVKTEDSGGLVCNDNAVLKTAYGISEVKSFKIQYDGSCGGEAGVEEALSHIFEKSIYQILTSDYKISPGMGDSLYYELGKNTIGGLTYIPPSVNNDMPMALKRIVGKLFSGVSISNLKFNNLKFYIRYKTQDSMRVSQVRPNLQDFVKNSSYEKYPHHEQFYGQQDKIVDSERFSLNLFGKLVRVGNSIFQCQEIVEKASEEKESGDLVLINNEPYYVTVVENEFYPDLVCQKVTYSKNFNQLSNIVTIPSEPRFYEVSERTKIRREKRMFDFLCISQFENPEVKNPTYLCKTKWQNLIKNLIFCKEKVDLPNYAWTRFIADKKRNHRGAYGQHISQEEMFPSSELDRSNPNQVIPKTSKSYADVIVPLLHFPLKDGLVFEWDMEDNFKAGDCIDRSISGNNNTVDQAYYALQSVRCCDVLGRADLFYYRLFHKIDWTHEQSQDLPKACIEPTELESEIYIPSNLREGLDKDCREELSFNYQISLLHRNESLQGDFITFSNLFGEKQSELYCCLLDSEVSMFNENTSVIPSEILADKVTYYLNDNYEKQRIEIVFDLPENTDLAKVKSLIFYEIDSEGNKVSYLAKNFPNGVGDCLPIFYIYPVFTH
ncbi:MAG: hypothetical protein IJX25_00305 [Clostridia bacterium]|nr:hypothetical protein [Clostridia bacterium]